MKKKHELIRKNNNWKINHLSQDIDYYYFF